MLDSTYNNSWVYDDWNDFFCFNAKQRYDNSRHMNILHFFATLSRIVF